MEKENSIPPTTKIRRALTPPLPEPPRITRSYSQKAAAFFQNASPLFKLPQELRDEIYRFILTAPPPLMICHTPCPDEELFTRHLPPSQNKLEEFGNLLFGRMLPHGTPSDPKILGLLLSCRRVYTEAIQILYGENSFYFKCGTVLPQWIEIVPPARLSLVRHITLESSPYTKKHKLGLKVWNDVIKAAKKLRSLRSVTVILRPVRWDVSAVLDLLEVVLEAEFFGLKILYGCAGFEEGNLKVLGDDGVFSF